MKKLFISLICLCLTSCSTTVYNIGITGTGEVENVTIEDRSFNEQLFNDQGLKLVINNKTTYIKVGNI